MQVTYERIFMECTGDRLHAAVSGALQFSRIGNATPVMQGIANNARAALQRTARRSPLNAMCMRKYGVQAGQGPNPGA